INWAENQLPSTVNNSARAMMAAVASFVKDIGGTVTSTGSANAYLLTLNNGFTSLATGEMATFKASFTNTGAATIAVNSLAAKALRKDTTSGASALGPGDITSAGLYSIIYDAAANSAAGAWVVGNPTPRFIAAITAGADFAPNASTLLTLNGNTAAP